MKKVDTIRDAIAARAEGKSKGGDRYQALLERAAATNELRLFVPWAAPPSGCQPGKYEAAALGWLAETTGALGELVSVTTVIMPADSYAARNGYDMAQAKAYWQTVETKSRGLLGEERIVVLPATEIEKRPSYEDYLARQAYAFERLPSDVHRRKIVNSAAKYTGTEGEEAYENAALYTMRRAAEADFVGSELDALWISLNYPERDIMCADTPRIYVPGAIRTPWLKEDSNAG